MCNTVYITAGQRPDHSFHFSKYFLLGSIYTRAKRLSIGGSGFWRLPAPHPHRSGQAGQTAECGEAKGLRLLPIGRGRSPLRPLTIDPTNRPTNPSRPANRPKPITLPRSAYLASAQEALRKLSSYQDWSSGNLLVSNKIAHLCGDQSPKTMTKAAPLIASQ
jgi:hypothetical protein